MESGTLAIGMSPAPPSPVPPERKRTAASASFDAGGAARGRKTRGRGRDDHASHIEITGEGQLGHHHNPAALDQPPIEADPFQQGRPMTQHRLDWHGYEAPNSLLSQAAAVDLRPQKVEGEPTDSWSSPYSKRQLTQPKHPGASLHASARHVAQTDVADGRGATSPVQDRAGARSSSYHSTPASPPDHGRSHGFVLASSQLPLGGAFPLPTHEHQQRSTTVVGHDVSFPLQYSGGPQHYQHHQHQHQPQQQHQQQHQHQHQHQHHTAQHGHHHRAQHLHHHPYASSSQPVFPPSSSSSYQHLAAATIPPLPHSPGSAAPQGVFSPFLQPYPGVSKPSVPGSAADRHIASPHCAVSNEDAAANVKSGQGPVYASHSESSLYRAPPAPSKPFRDQDYQIQHHQAQPFHQGDFYQPSASFNPDNEIQSPLYTQFEPSTFHSHELIVPGSAAHQQYYPDPSPTGPSHQEAPSNMTQYCAECVVQGGCALHREQGRLPSSSTTTVPSEPRVEPEGETTSKEPRSLSNQTRSRRPFSEEERAKTAETRKNKACVRCRIQRVRCEAVAEDPEGACSTCLKMDPNSKKVLHRGMCVRSKLTDVILYREGGLNLTRRWDRPVLKDVGDWASPEIRVIEIMQGLCSQPMRLRVRKFNPVDGDVSCRVWSDNGVLKKKDLKPYALASIHETLDSFRKYVYENAILAMSEEITRLCESDPDDIIHQNYRAAIMHYHTLQDNADKTYMENFFQLWFAIRLKTGSSYISGEDTLDMEPETQDPSYPLLNHVSTPRMVVAQVDCLNSMRVLAPLRTKILKYLEQLINSNNPAPYFTIYITVFILLHEISVACEDRYVHARRKDLENMYSVPKFVEEVQRGGIHLLSHWHYYQRGTDPSAPEHDSTNLHKSWLKGLTTEQLMLVTKSWKHFRRLKSSSEFIDIMRQKKFWNHKYWWISQMFEVDWKRQDTWVAPYYQEIPAVRIREEGVAA